MEARANAGIEHEPKPNAFAVNDAEALKNDQVQQPGGGLLRSASLPIERRPKWYG